MLTKLIKYEFSGLLKTNLLLWVMFAALSLSMCVGGIFRIDFIHSILLMTSVLASIGTVCFYMIHSLLRFHKQICGEESYFTYTVPTTIHTTLLSKLVPYFVYVLVLILVVAGHWAFVYKLEIMEPVNQLIDTLFAFAKEEPALMTHTAVTFALSGVFIACLVVFAIAFGYMPRFRDRNMSLGVTAACGIVLNQAVGLVVILVGLLLGLFDVNNLSNSDTLSNAAIHQILWLANGIELVLSVLFYTVGAYLLGRKRSV